MSDAKKSNVGLSLLAGGISGAVEATLTYPAEYVKTQLQLQSKLSKTAPSHLTATAPVSKGPVDCVVQTVRNHGVLGLYRGLSAMAIGNAAKASVRFVAYEQFVVLVGKAQDSFARRESPSAGDVGGQSGGAILGEKIGTVGMMIAGLGAGMTEAALVVTPSETIKTKFIDDQNSAKPRYQGLIHGTRLIIKEEGLAGIYRGLVPVMLRQGANQAVRFTTYGKIRDFFAAGYPKDDKGKRNDPWYVSFASGVAAGIVTVYATMPFDVLKTKMQGIQGKAKYGTSLNCIRVMFQEEGVLAFWKGATPRLGRLMFSGAIVFTSYEQLMKLFERIGWK
ncbi:mitochondrial carrier [Gonapodya prolifera JEL478]|uniref:Mitochondrial carrier n=1 Tax=Gonapodya prolifera (strain JEL478) TaxID=1344416 RepID=A0A139AJM0_GONPJ|nr:mitochondrial carrier [Gonapodya prolifera JEL478]|eukprot:KXS17006.1 mitochondrial carrier [Gonapodya prolifera JEL478]